MSELKIDIENYDTNSHTGSFDLLCVDINDFPETVTNCSLITITSGDEQMCFKIKFEWKESNEFDDSDFLHIPETNILFFRRWNQWGAIDLANKVLKRHEAGIGDPFISLEDDYILIYDDLIAESTRLNGDRIHFVPIDPPTEWKYFGDRIEFRSPSAGLQILRTK